VTFKLRVWVVFGKRLKFGDGRARLLELIEERGSLRQAAAELRMSYRHAWGYLREMEKAAGFKLVERAPEGRPQVGMRLTAGGREFLACYRKFQRGLDRAAAGHFERSFTGTAFGARARKGRLPASRDASAASSSRTAPSTRGDAAPRRARASGRR
jgi:molybdate transport system regulatory protein